MERTLETVHQQLNRAFKLFILEPNMERGMEIDGLMTEYAKIKNKEDRENPIMTHAHVSDHVDCICQRYQHKG